MSVSLELKISNRTAHKFSHTDKLINQTSSKHVSQITLVINNKC